MIELDDQLLQCFGFPEKVAKVLGNNCSQKNNAKQSKSTMRIKKIARPMNCEDTKPQDKVRHQTQLRVKKIVVKPEDAPKTLFEKVEPAKKPSAMLHSVEATIKGVCIVFDTSSLLKATSRDLSQLATMNHLVIPWKTLCELDTHHYKNPDLRTATTEIRDWIFSRVDRLGKESNVTIQGRFDVDPEWNKTVTNADDHILGCAVFMKKHKLKDAPLLLCTDDKYLSLKARGEGIQALPFRNLRQS